MATKPKKKAQKNALQIHLESLTDAKLTRSNKHIIALAKKSKLSVETVYRAVLGDRLPGFEASKKIAKATDGKVKDYEIAGF